MSDPLKGKRIVMGGKARTIKFTFKALRLAQQRFNGMPVRTVLKDIDVDQCCELAACGLYHEDKTISAQQVEQWLEEEPLLFLPLCTAVIESISEAYRRMTPVDPDAPPGEAGVPPGAPDGTPVAGQTSG